MSRFQVIGRQINLNLEFYYQKEWANLKKTINLQLK